MVRKRHSSAQKLHSYAACKHAPAQNQNRMRPCMQLDRPRNRDSLCALFESDVIQAALTRAPEPQAALSTRLVMLAQELLQDGESDTVALTLLRAALNIAPARLLPRIHHQRAAVELQRGELQLALEAVDKAIASFPRQAHSQDDSDDHMDDLPCEGAQGTGAQLGAVPEQCNQVGDGKRSDGGDEEEQQRLACAVLRLKVLMQVRSLLYFHQRVLPLCSTARRRQLISKAALPEPRHVVQINCSD